MVAADPWCSLACCCITLISTFVVNKGSPNVSLCLLRIPDMIGAFLSFCSITSS
jgi:hypothetical protein